ncbi:hypothetical protein C0Q70_13552 [Pomacea canaliculata]|uniref:Uncharacterized protein n=1 Tax=Pomacea canaliculata TaxID=400727 RepID=A0A2T7NXJ6_POMCA|nr:hypothetical protein C0Q70_13552 [Pomacea canaliculata]
MYSFTVAAEVQSWVRTIIPGVVTPTLFLFGAPANIVCAMVFYKQSLKERINVCLFALALTDFIALTVDFLLAAEHIYRTFIAPSTILLECLVGLTGFVFASQFLSCVIACERCFCVVSPFKAQKYLKTSTMAAIVLLSCCVIVGGLCVIAGYKHTSVLNFDPVTNHTVKVFGYTQ